MQRIVHMSARVLVATLATCMLWACDGEKKDSVEPKSKTPSLSTKTQSPKANEATTPKANTTQPTAAVGMKSLTGKHFGVYNLLHNRPLSHRVEVVNNQKVLVVDAVAKDVVRYINGNYPNDWNIGIQAGGENATAIRSGRKAQMWFPALADPAGEMAIQLKVYNPAKGINTLKLKLNGKALATKGLKPGWHTVTIPVPAGVGASENHLMVEFTDMGRFAGKLSGGALQWLRFGPAKALGESTAKAPAKTPLAQNALQLDKGQGTSWFVWAVPKSKLVFDLSGPADCGPTIDVMTEGSAGKLKAAASQKFSKSSGQAILDLSAIAGANGQITRVDVHSSCASPVTLKGANLMVPGTKPNRPEFKKPKYIVFWMIDTLRADHLPFYNSKTNVKAPALADIASNGALFKVAYVQGNESKVSHASLFSALYPNRHRVLAKGSLKPHHEIMPEAIKKAGYTTGAHISNGYISQPWGFVQGWNHYVNNLRDGWRIDGASMAQHGIKWAMKNKEKPFFLYLGTIDPHVTYRAHKGIIEQYDTEPYNGPYKKYLSGTTLGKIKGGNLSVGKRDRTRIINLYKNEITFNDQAFASLRKAFEDAGMWKDTMVVVTADHGDEFWEHGGVGHGHNIHQELVHVPLIVYYPPAIKAKTVINAGVDVLDVYPTIVDIAGKKRPKNLQGKSLLPLTYGAHGGYPQPAIATRYLGHYAMQARQWKLYLRKGDYAIYDRNSDPNEMKNTKAAHPLAARWLLDGMGWFRAYRGKWDKTSFGVALNVSGSFLNELKKPQPKP